MRADRAEDGSEPTPPREPGQRGNDGPPTEPRQAATVILLRGGGQALEVLLVQRSPQARFMGGVWVFPGGALDPGELEGSSNDGDSGHRAAAIRELQEEAGIVLGAEAELVELSRWITPAEVEIRFDTRFFLAQMPDDGQRVTLDGRECVDYRWLTPAAALEAHERQEIALVFPTIKHLEHIAAYDTAAALLEHARGRKVSPVQPKIVIDGDGAPRVILTGDPARQPS